MLTSSGSGSSAKPPKPPAEHRERPFRDSREPKSALRAQAREPHRAPKGPTRNPKENQPLKPDWPKMGFKEPKAVSWEGRPEGPNAKATAKRPPAPGDVREHPDKKRRREPSDSSPRRQHPDARVLKERRQARPAERKGAGGGEGPERGRTVSTLPPFQDLVDPNDSDSDDNASPKYEVRAIFLQSVDGW